ncbi:MAG: beta-ketoacyl synthase N-terminal-like domain-containing protein [Myxococcota bacterium]
MTATPITAYAAYNALGKNAEGVLEALAAGRSGLDRIESRSGPSRCWGRAPNPPALPEALGAIDNRARRLLASVCGDLAQPVVTACRRWGAHRVALVLGVHGPDAQWLREATEASTPTRVVHERGTQGPLTLAQQLLDLRGPAYCVAGEGAAGAAAIAAGHRLLQAGLADAVVAGGVGVLSSVVGESYASRRLLSEDEARPLSAVRAGTSLGEGAALVLMERHGDAFVELLGSAEAHDGTGAGRAATPAISAALERAGVDAGSVGFVQMHAPGTITHDFNESAALRECFGAGMPVASMVGATGLVLGAAGATDVIVAAAALRDGFIPNTVGCDPPDSTLGVVASARRRELEQDYALVHAATLGGRSVALVIGARA